MTDTPQHAEHAAPQADLVDDFDASFDEWIDGATIARRSLIIYADGAVQAEIQRLLREREAIEAEQGGEETQGDLRLEENDAALAALRERREASRSEWILHALTDADNEALEEMVPRPKPPIPLIKPTAPVKPSPTQAEAHKRAMAEYDRQLPDFEAAVDTYETESAKWLHEFNVHLAWRGVDEIRLANGKVIRNVTLEQVRRLVTKVGRRPIYLVAAEVADAGKNEVAIPAPFSQPAYETDQT